MIVKNLFLLTNLLSSVWLIAQVPNSGSDSLLEVGCWNVEWLGDSNNGPTNDALQYSNVRTVLDNTNIDIWGLCEVSNLSTFMNLLTDLPEYDGILATYSQTQKTALLYKKQMFSVLSSQHILNTSDFSYDFAGRPPLEVVLKTTYKPQADTLYIYVVHLKAQADQDSYNRRKNASAHLKSFLDANRKHKHVMVIGDWNDNVTFPIWSGATETPFRNFILDSLHYFFTSKRLSELGKTSFAPISGSMIDHQLISNEWFDRYVPQSSIVLDNLPSQISGYVSNTSDHYPVISYFLLSNPDTTTSVYMPGPTLSVVAYPNPMHDVLFISGISEQVAQIRFYDMHGQSYIMDYTLIDQELRVDIPDQVATGSYVVHLTTLSGNVACVRITINR